MFHGLINVYKEPGHTSFHVVAALRSILGQKKIGHTGTLDPEAEGVLLVCLGNGTRLVEMLEDRSKEYRCRMLLGTTTDTEDTTGEVLSEKAVECNEEQIRECIMSFEGGYDQIPPMYSALKVGGKRLYELAREGVVIERKPRHMELSSIVIEEINLPYVTFTVACSKGTYIRSLCRDIGEKLGCGGCMDHLLRTRVSSFMLEDSLKLDEIRQLKESGLIDEKVISVEKVFEEYNCLYVNENGRKKIDNGNPLTTDEAQAFGTSLSSQDEAKAIEPEDSCLFRTYNADKRFKAVYRYDAGKRLYIPEKMFPDL